MHALGTKAMVILLAIGLLGPAAGAMNIATVPVGNPGNPGELSGATAAAAVGYSGGSGGPDRICGSVAYEYRMGKYEVTAGQYAGFLNSVAASDPYGLYNAYMDYDADPTRKGCNIKRSGPAGSYSYSVAADWADRPVNYVSFWDACRFTNWLENGQGGPGTTETGSYTLDGYNGSDGRTIQRNAGAHWALPSEDEWYKAAYHMNDGVTGNYQPRPTGPWADNRLIDPDPGHNATFYNGSSYTIGGPYWRTEVGAHENSSSPYGTFDQGGNVWEWIETIVYEGTANRGARGGNYASDSRTMDSVLRDWAGPPTGESSYTGLRVVLVPEPGAILLLALGSVGIVRRRKT